MKVAPPFKIFLLISPALEQHCYLGRNTRRKLLKLDHEGYYYWQRKLKNTQLRMPLLETYSLKL